MFHQLACGTSYWVIRRMLAETPFWQQLILNAVGPLTTVVLGGLVVGAIANFLARPAQHPREAWQIGRELLDESTEVGTGQYFLIQQMRGKANLPAGMDSGGERQDFSSAWFDYRVRGEVLRWRFVAHFAKDSPLTWHWHRAMR